MKDKAVFFATPDMLRSDGVAVDLFSATINIEEWKALRLLTLAGYTIVLFTPQRATVYAECHEPYWVGGHGVVRVLDRGSQLNVISIEGRPRD